MKVECSVVRDLLPLYLENMVSKQTAQYVRQHLSECPECQQELESYGSIPENNPVQQPESESKSFRKIMGRLNRQLYFLSYGLIIFFILLGFSLTGGSDLMYNSLIMPVVGLFGYYVFRWKALYKMPGLLLVVNLLAYCLRFAQIDFLSVFSWTLIYSLFVLVGVLIAFLLHFAFNKE